MAATRAGVVTFEGELARLPLKNGMVALLDAADVPMLEGYWWSATLRRHRWYVIGATKCRRGEKSTWVYLHRHLTGASRGLDVDHANLDGLDNRRRNIRVSTATQNNANAGKRRGATTSRFKGVYLCRSSGTWRMQICVSGRVTTSAWPTEEAAARAYDGAAREAFGEFARLNFPAEVS